MSIVEASEKDLQEDRQLKVTVPTETLIRLHSLKILTGKNISDQVLEALNRYFEVLEDEADETGQGAGTNGDASGASAA